MFLVRQGGAVVLTFRSESSGMQFLVSLFRPFVLLWMRYGEKYALIVRGVVPALSLPLASCWEECSGI